MFYIFSEVRKVLLKLGKEKGCEIVNEWIRSCLNHLHWSASTTANGDGNVIWAKFKTFLSHILDKHEGLNDPLFDKCSHGDIEPRKWLLEGKKVKKISIFKMLYAKMCLGVWCYQCLL